MPDNVYSSFGSRRPFRSESVRRSFSHCYMGDVEMTEKFLDQVLSPRETSRIKRGSISPGVLGMVPA